MKSNLPEDLRMVIAEAVKAAGASVYDVEFSGASLQVRIESESGVTVGLCARVSELLSRRLDQQDLIPHRHRLEVSSPGLDRRLCGVGDFQRSIGKQVRIVTAEGVCSGIVRAVNDGKVWLSSADKLDPGRMKRTSRTKDATGQDTNGISPPSRQGAKNQRQDGADRAEERCILVKDVKRANLQIPDEELFGKRGRDRKTLEKGIGRMRRRGRV